MTPDQVFSLVEFGKALFSPEAVERRIAMFRAYFDDSKRPGKKPAVVTMACYVASDVIWDAFLPCWKEMLRGEGLEHLHMKELTFRHNGKRVGAYKDWDDEREKQFQEKAHRIIDITIEMGVSWSVNVAAYRNTVSAKLNQIVGGPYGLCAFMCLRILQGFAKQEHWKEPCACFFESGSGYGKEITALQIHLRKNPTWARGLRGFCPRTWTFTDKDLAPQLEAADVFAYESNHFWHEMDVVKSERRTKKSLQNLVLMNDKHWGNYLNEAKLRMLLEDFAKQGMI